MFTIEGFYNDPALVVLCLAPGVLTCMGNRLCSGKGHRLNSQCILTTDPSVHCSGSLGRPQPRCSSTVTKMWIRCVPRSHTNTSLRLFDNTHGSVQSTTVMHIMVGACSRLQQGARRLQPDARDQRESLLSTCVTGGEDSGGICLRKSRGAGNLSFSQSLYNKGWEAGPSTCLKTPKTLPSYFG